MLKKSDMLAGVASAALTIAITVSAPAFAADLSERMSSAPAFVAPTLPDWAGLYLGGHVGYGWAEFEGCDSSPSSCSSLFEVEVDGFLAGFHIGHNWQMGNTVLGIEGDVSLTPGWSGKVATTSDTSSGVSGSLDALASIRGRLGWSFDSALIYATGGVAFAQSNAIGASTPDNFATSPDIVVGPVAGAGIEWQHSQNLSFRAEGLYYWFDEERRDPFSSGVAGLQDTWVVRVGASWRPWQPN